MTRLASPASEKQLGFIASLRAERGITTPLGELSKSAASALITELMAMPRPRKATAAAPAGPVVALEAGVYRVADGTLFRVYVGRESGRMLAKRVLTEGGFEYAGAASRFVTADQRLSVEEAAAWGLEWGVCCCCGRLLTDPESVAAGIGPICASKY